MSETILTCKVIHHESTIHVVSPLIGRVELLVSEGDIVVPGQIIGGAVRLNRCFSLKLPDNVFGKLVSRHGRDRVVPVGYGEVLLEVTTLHDAQVACTHAVDRKETKSSSVDAPMDGMFYLSPSPKDPPYVKIGDVISPGQTIGLIEVMKCFYPLKYQGAGKVQILDIKVSSASPVSLGTKLMIIQ